MIEPGKALREGFAQALDGNLTYDTVNVPVFDQKVEGTPNLYVLLGNMRDENRTNKTRFVTEKLFDIEVYNIRKSSAKSVVLADVGEQILGIIVPTNTTLGFTVEGFNVTFCRLESATAEEPVMKGTDIIQRYKQTFRTRIVQ